MGKSSPSILDLPPELITHIIDYTHHSEHFNFASTCRFLHDCSKDVLEAHQKAYEEYHTCSDVLPTTVPTLLRKILDDPMVAWHVRGLEFYEMRDCWAWWRPCQFVSDKSSSVRGSGEPLPYALDQDEWARCLEVLREELFFTESDLEKARADFQAGNDAPMKALIVALCPRLVSLKFSRDLIVSGREAFDPLESFPPRPPARDCRMGRSFQRPRSCLDYIQRTILHCFANTTGRLKWPAGFSSLSDLAVGMQTDTDIDRTSTESPPSALFDLMRLPKLESLYWDNVDLTFERGNCDWGILKSSSSVQHIFIDAPGLLAFDALLSAPKCLKTLASSDPDLHVYNLPKLALAVQQENLESLMLYKTNIFPDNRWEPSGVQDAEITFARLKHMTIEYDDFFRKRMNWTPRGSGPTQMTKRSTPCLDFLDWIQSQLFPRSLETIVLVKSLQTETLSENEADEVDDAMLSVIACKETCLPNLKSLFLGALEDESSAGYSSREHTPRTRRWFTKSIRAGQEAGIDVHTRTTPGSCLHHVELPRPPCSADLKFVPRRDEIPPEFDVYHGEWTSPACGNCGRCEGCLRLYEASVWEEIGQE